MSSITKVKFQSICLQIESTKYFKSFVVFWISYLHRCLETALKTGPFNFSTLCYSTINFANGLQDFITSRYALKSLRFSQEQRVSCNTIWIIACITSDETFPKQTPNKVILSTPKGTQRVSLELQREYADILYLNFSPRARFGEGLVLPTMENNWISHTKRRVEARDSYIRSWRSRSSSARRWRSVPKKTLWIRMEQAKLWRFTVRIHRQIS